MKNITIKIILMENIRRQNKTIKIILMENILMQNMLVQDRKMLFS